jgi:hypothetical protein
MTTALTAVEINCTTGEVVERPFTAEEIAQYQADTAAMNEQKAIEEATAAAKAEAKASAEAKLAALGLTPEEIAALR